MDRYLLYLIFYNMLYKIRYIILFGLVIWGSSCKEKPDTLFTKLSSQETNINFENTITNSPDFNIFKYRNFYNGGGVGIGDINNDGLADLVLTANQANNKIYLNSKDFKFKDITETSGFSRKGGGDKLLRNDDNFFVDVSETAGIYGSLIGFGLGITVGDINNDNWQDIYVSNDFYERDYLYINQKDGTFSEEIEKWAPHISLSSMGADLSDINNDGHPDIFVTDMLVEDLDRLKETSEFERYDLFQLKQKKNFHKQYMQNTLQLNNGNSSFSEIAYYSGVAKTDWSWSALLSDMDNDGHKDIFVSNGIYHDLTNQDFINFTKK